MDNKSDFQEVGEAFLAHFGVIEHRDDEYDSRKAHDYYMRNRKLKGRANKVFKETKWKDIPNKNTESDTVKKTRDLAYKNASSEDKKIFSIPSKQRTREQSFRMIRLVNAANTTVEQNKRKSTFVRTAPPAKPRPKKDRVKEFSPTLSTIIKDGKSVAKKGKSFINRLFG